MNLFTTAKVGIEENGRGYKEVAVIERFKQESMYGLIVHKDKKVVVSGGSTFRAAEVCTCTQIYLP